MKIKALIMVIGLISLIGISSAVTVNDCHKVFATEKGPSGVMLPLGFEVFFPVNVSTQYYNYLSLFLIFLIGLSIGQRDERFGALATVGMSAFCVYIGWLNYSGVFAVVALCSVPAIFGYITQANREKYGQRGQGSLLMNLVVVIIVAQVVFGIVNASTIFPTAMQSTITTTYANMDISKEIVTISNSGGALQSMVDFATVMGDMAISGFRLLVSIIYSLIWLKGVILVFMPWLASNVWTDAVLWAVQFAEWTIYAIFAFNLFWKPGFETVRV
jgi:hypothetical protein